MSKLLNNTSSLPVDLLKKAEYVKSFQAAANDKEIVDMAEEGLEEYIKILDELCSACYE